MHFKKYNVRMVYILDRWHLIILPTQFLERKFILKFNKYSKLIYQVKSV
jgi:hypothetical protein